MANAKLKTTKTEASVEKFLHAISDKKRREDCYAVLEIMKKGLSQKGRVVILGEAAMLAAQRLNDEQFGMQVAGIDNRQLALNIMHWLSRVL